MILVPQILSFALFISAAELFFLSRKKETLSVWSFENLRSDLLKGLPLPRFLVQAVFSDRSFPVLTTLQAIVAVCGILSPHLWVFVALFFLHLMVCIRFRGTFNGGSDMMAFVLLTGVIIAYVFPGPWGWFYILIHLLYSYFKAGIVKLLAPEWRQGRALGFFLKRSLFKDIRLFGGWLQGNIGLQTFLCWAVLIFELAAPFIFFIPQALLVYGFVAVFFHFCIYWSFGLNRFFWNWLAAWSALLVFVK